MLTRTFSLVLFLSLSFVIQAQESYPVHPDAVAREGVPQGKVTQFQFSQSKVYPGTVRDVFVYVPHQYDGTTPAAVMVFQDGQNYVRKNSSWNVPTVFDNLIDRGDMPVTVAICVNPGVVSGNPDVESENDFQAQDRFNRSLEYDAVSDRYARFIIEEILPAVEKDVRLTDDPNLRGIGGSSSGAIAAFGVAWHRPSEFRRVFSTVGTYVGLRGGDEYHSLVRKTEPKPLRVFLQDGSNDLNIYGGDWWHANLTMHAALKWAGYPVEHAWGTGGHNGLHGSAIFPDAMKWLWADHEEPIRATIADHPEFSTRLIEGQPWRRLNLGLQRPTLVCDDGATGWFVLDAADGQIVHFASPENLTPTDIARLSGVTAMLSDGAGGLFVAIENGLKHVTKSNAGQWSAESVAGIDQFQINDMILLPSSSPSLMLLAGQTSGSDSSAIYEFVPEQPLKLIDKAISGPNQLTLTPDQRFVNASGSDPRYVWSGRRRTNGDLDAVQPYHHLHRSTESASADVTELQMLADGSLVAGTSLGLQIFDQPGRVHCIIPLPSNAGVTGFDFVGSSSSTMVACDGSTVWIRPTRMIGIDSDDAAVQPEKPHL